MTTAVIGLIVVRRPFGQEIGVRVVTAGPSPTDLSPGATVSAAWRPVDAGLHVA